MTINERIAEARLHSDPFPHLIVDDVLPDDVYRSVLDVLPMDEPSDGFADFRLDNSAAKPLQELTRFWLIEVFGPLMSRLLPYAPTMFFEATGSAPDEKLGRPLSQEDFRAGGVLQHRTSGQVHGAHLDSAGSMFTSVVYLGQPDSDPRDGTIFYEPVKPKLLLNGYRERKRLGPWLSILGNRFSGKPSTLTMSQIASSPLSARRIRGTASPSVTTSTGTPCRFLAF